LGARENGLMANLAGANMLVMQPTVRFTRDNFRLSVSRKKKSPLTLAGAHQSGGKSPHDLGRRQSKFELVYPLMTLSKTRKTACALHRVKQILKQHTLLLFWIHDHIHHVGINGNTKAVQIAD
jgi:hypothetical protein